MKQLTMFQIDEEDGKYSKKIDAPVYHPRGIQPDIRLLCDDSKTRSLVDEIKASNIKEEMGQKDTQQAKNGLSNVYRDNGTYVKSFFSVMYNPSCVKAAMMGANHKRIHHTINWANAVPQIIDSKYKK